MKIETQLIFVLKSETQDRVLGLDFEEAETLYCELAQIFRGQVKPFPPVPDLLAGEHRDFFSKTAERLNKKFSVDEIEKELRDNGWQSRKPCPSDFIEGLNQEPLEP